MNRSILTTIAVSLILVGQSAVNAQTTRVSIAAGGAQANAECFDQAISADGRFVVFVSGATNLDPSVTNGTRQIYRHDRLTGATTLVSRSTTGQVAAGQCNHPSISADGRFVAFDTSASNLVSGDTNGRGDIFIRDTFLGTTTRASLGPASAQPNDDSFSASLSNDGLRVAFASVASNLVTGDTNGATDAFIRDLTTGVTTRVNVGPGGIQSAGLSGWPVISGNGQFVVFASDATNLIAVDTNNARDVFVRDLNAGVTERASVATGGGQANLGGGYDYSVSDDGRYVAFSSDSTNLDIRDLSSGTDIYVRDRLTNQTTLESVNDAGTKATGAGVKPRISADGNWIAFSSDANNLVPPEPNPWFDVFVRDRTTGHIARATGSTTGVESRSGADYLSGLSANGRFVAYDSTATDLVPGDTNGVRDVFVSDTVTGCPSPVISAQPSDQSACVGQSLTFGVTATGGALGYQWFKNGTAISGATNAGYTINPVTAGDAGIYNVLVSDGCGSIFSDSVFAKIGFSLTSQPPASVGACEGAPLTLSVRADGALPFSYQWRKGGNDIAGATSADFTIASVSSGDASVYTVVVTNACGTQTSSGTTVTTKSPIVIQTQPQNQNPCAGQNGTFTVVATGTSPLTYQWRRNGFNVSGGTSATLVRAPTPSNLGTYDVVITNPCGALTSATATLTLNTADVPAWTTPPASQTRCIGDNVTFSGVATGPGLAYQWREFNQSTQSFVNIPGATASSLTFNSISAADNGRSFMLVVTNSCGTIQSSAAALRVERFPVGITQQPISQTLCANSLLTLNAAISVDLTPTIVWRHNGEVIPGADSIPLVIPGAQPGDAGTYELTVSTTCSTATSNTVTVTVNTYNPPVISQQPLSLTVCEGSPATFTVVATGPGTLSYQWRKDGVPIPGETASTFSINAVAVSQACSYDVLVTGSCGSATSTSAELNVMAEPLITRHPVGRAANLQETITLTVSATGPGLIYQWRKNGVDLPGADQSILTLSSIQPADAGDYAVLVTSNCGASTLSNAATLTVGVNGSMSMVNAAGSLSGAEVGGVACSANGRMVAFSTNEPQPGLPQFGDGLMHLYVRDRQTGQTTLVDGGGGDVAGDCGNIGAGTGWIAFDSNADNIVPVDTNGVSDVFFQKAATPHDVICISRGPGGAASNGPSLKPVVSADGRTVVFESDASNLVPGDGNGVKDLFLYDAQAGTMTRISSPSGGGEADGASYGAAISNDGQTIAFVSEASNLTTGDTNGSADIFVYLRPSATIVRVSTDSANQEANGNSVECSIDAYGRYVAFSSAATNLTPGDANGRLDVFVKDLQTSALTKVSVASNGTAANFDCRRPNIAGNGRWVAFVSRSNSLVAGDTANYDKIFVHDRDPDNNSVFDETNSMTVRASVGYSSTEANGDSDYPLIGSIAAGYPFVYFQCQASNLTDPADPDTNCRTDVFRRHLIGSSTIRMAHNSLGEQADGHCLRPTLGLGDGVLYYASDARNLGQPQFTPSFRLFMAANNGIGATSLVNPWIAGGSAGLSKQPLSADGRYIVFTSRADLLPGGGANNQAYVRDLTTGTLTRVSVNGSGVAANGNCSAPSISADGRYVAYMSSATNLTVDDLNGSQFDIFRFDRQTQTVQLVSVDSSGNAADGRSEDPVISADGSRIAFISLATNLVIDDTNARRDIYMREMIAGMTTRVSVGPGGAQTNQDCRGHSISDDGRYVAFETSAPLISGDTNNENDVFIRDVQAGVTQRVSNAPGGSAANLGAWSAFISPAGDKIAFSSVSTDLIPNFSSPHSNVFVKDLSTGDLRAVSLTEQSTIPTQDSYAPAMSADGRYVVFLSRANLVAADNDSNLWDAYLADMQVCVAPSILQSPLDGNYYSNQPIALTVQANGTPPLSYQWRKDGVNLGGPTGSTLTIPAAGAGDAGSYDVVVTGPCGSATSSPAVIDVQTCSPITTMVSVSNAGAAAGMDNSNPALSADGRYVAVDGYQAYAVPFEFGAGAVYVRDRLTGAVTAINARPDGTPPASGISSYPSLSDDGRFVAFQSSSSDLVAGDTNNQTDVFLRDRDPDGNGYCDEPGAFTMRVSVSTGGGQADSGGSSPKVSGDGRYVLFASRSQNLVADPPAPWAKTQLYRFDRITNTTIRVSCTATGDPAAEDCIQASISTDGRFVVFRSSAGNLVPIDTNLGNDIFVKDIQTGTVTLANLSLSGTQMNGDYLWPSMSADGRFVAFLTSVALDPLDTNGLDDVYVRDLPSGVTTRETAGSGGASANGASTRAALSGDGRYLAMYTDASNLAPNDLNGFRDLLIKDRQTGLSTIGSVGMGGAASNAGTGVPEGTSPLDGLVLSAQGNCVAFYSSAYNLVPADKTGTSEMFVRDLAAGQTVRALLTGPGVPGSDLATWPSISGDGRYVTFQSDSGNLVANDSNDNTDIFVTDVWSGDTVRINLLPGGVQTSSTALSVCPSISRNGRYIAYRCSAAIAPDDTNNLTDIVVYDRQTGTSIVANRSTSGAQADSSISDSPAHILSATGRFVVFTSSATNLVAGDTNNANDVFLRDRDTDDDGVFDEPGAVATTRASVSSTGSQVSTGGASPSISDDGRYVAFTSSSSQVVPGDTNNLTDVFVRDRQLATTFRASLGADGAQANAGCSAPMISGDGRYVVFVSSATNLVAGDTNNQSDVFVRDLVANTTVIASLTDGDQPSNGWAEKPVISADGRFVAWQSGATNLVGGDTNDAIDVFVRDLVAGTTARVSIGPNAEQGERDSYDAAISDNGLYVAFASKARTFMSSVTWTGSNIFHQRRNDCAPPGFVTNPNSLAVRPGQPAFMEVVVTANPPPTLQWRKDGQPISGATQRVLAVAHVSAASEGQYDVVATNALGLTVSAPATLILVNVGDVNCDEGVNASDIEAFVLALINPAAYGQAYPTCSTLNADLNGDGRSDGLDVAPFVHRLVSP